MGSQLYFLFDEPPCFVEPKNDNERLLNYQHDFLVYGCQSAWLKLWQLSYEIAGRLIQKERKQKGFFLDCDLYEEKKACAVEYVLRRYKTRFGYCVTSNFISVLRDGVRHALYHRTKADMLVDFVESVELLK